MRELIAKRAAVELTSHSVINLGIGIPTLVADYITDPTITLHTENGMLGVTAVEPEKIDPLIVNAGKQPVGEGGGASYFSSAQSFAMIRGGHVNTAILGALQIDEKGRIANWAIPGKDIIGVGGAMDLLEGAQRIIITTSHTANDGTPKIVESCTFPITSKRVADMIITELAVFKWNGYIYELIELVGDATLEEVQNKTEARFKISEGIKGESFCSEK
ncbi:3-oxoacid CoA-transferase [Sporosarcina newyorkensis]|uniref:3-oxoacid CoA-transferase n=2 Tax=Sporosarcina newyorkensis TaxID=759851 RepID=A0A1T4YAP1_9BACL|nr:3-oxoacid CoA-transferase [Sporosarcina newyorkensis]